MRIALLGMAHETNTFSRVPASYEQFQRTGILHGDEIVREYRDSHHTNAGFLQAADAFGFEVVPLLYTHTGPIGTITKDAFDRIVGEMLQLLKDNDSWDGVLLAQHGAAVSEEYPDADGEVTARVRALLGPDVPVGMNLDLHANVSQKMIDNTTVTTFYRTNPHLDARERAFHCAELIVRTIRGEIKPVQALEMPPVVINIVKQFTGEEPMKSVMEDAKAVDARPGILSCSVAEGYPYADVEEMGMAFLAISDNDEAAARDAAHWLAQRAWERREQFVSDTLSPAEALKEVVASAKGPVVLMDVGDNIGGGGSADSTYILAEAKRMGVRSFLQTLYDPEAVQACVAAGVGSEITLKVGGKTDDMHGSPAEVTGRVRTISDGKFEDPQPYSRRLALLRRRHDGEAGHHRRPYAGAYQPQGRQHQPPADVLHRDTPRRLPGSRCQGRCIPAPGLRACCFKNHPGQYRRRHHVRPVLLPVQATPQAAVPL
jgi:microcystin degradation protein MlrC